MRFDVITLFPAMLEALHQYGISGRAFRKKLCLIRCWDPRDFAENLQGSIDDRPYGGGPGMVMQAAPLRRAVNAARASQQEAGVSPYVLYLSPQGSPFNQQTIDRLLSRAALIFIAGRYEGVDERFIARYVDEEISIGDYVLSGGELPAMVIMDALIRRLPGALNDQASAKEDSFFNGLLDYPHYTRPEVFEGIRVPDVLLSGDHAKIKRWRLKQSLGRTWLRRPELFRQRLLDREEAQLLIEFQQER